MDRLPVRRIPALRIPASSAPVAGRGPGLSELVLERRLEEGWLTAGGCLRHGHRVAHADAARAAIDGFNATASDQAARRAWLSGLQARFSTHPASSQP